MTESTFGAKVASWLPLGVGEFCPPKNVRSCFICAAHTKEKKSNFKEIAPFSSSSSHCGSDYVSAVILCTMGRVKISQFEGWFHIHPHEYSLICAEWEFGVSLPLLLPLVLLDWQPCSAKHTGKISINSSRWVLDSKPFSSSLQIL